MAGEGAILGAGVAVGGVGGGNAGAAFFGAGAGAAATMHAAAELAVDGGGSAGAAGAGAGAAAGDQGEGGVASAFGSWGGDGGWVVAGLAVVQVSWDGRGMVRAPGGLPERQCIIS